MGEKGRKRSLFILADHRKDSKASSRVIDSHVMSFAIIRAEIIIRRVQGKLGVNSDLVRRYNTSTELADLCVELRAIPAHAV